MSILYPPADELCSMLFWLLPSASTHDEFDIVFKNGPASTFSASRFENRQYSFLHNVLPVPCHSHNDYWRRTPLYAALGSGCISVEADVWLFDDDLFVGHSIKSLNSVSTLRSMYLDPLHRILEAANAESAIGGVATDGKQGVFATYPTQTLVLLVDFKTEGPETYSKLHEQLQGFRNSGWLTHWNGTDRVERPITIVVSGNAPFDIIANANTTYRDVFYDAPLTSLEADGDPTTTSASGNASAQTSSLSTQDMLKYKYNPSNSWYASSNLKTVEHGIASWFAVTPDEIEKLGQHMRQAELRGLRSRYWGTPRWPRSLRDQIWQILLQQGASILNVDDLRAARKGSWGRWS
ncbi:unnamed protein product [Aureobasidium mustum]|uniref:Altered inheritance of mitochondria protein 6 n=1 Tax=Aureobasidium mustum TaxID=2773714 RepID=A0A9N8JVV2_9PEZI|nr:unnamed protein product [Aureobasidium mustum]